MLFSFDMKLGFGIKKERETEKEMPTVSAENCKEYLMLPKL